MAKAMPVFPLVGSRIVSPGRRRPDSSASRTMNSAGRSLMLPVGLRSSSLAHRRTGGAPSGTVGDSRGRPTSGVPPHASSRLSYRAIGSNAFSRLVGGGGALGRAAQESRRGSEPEGATGHGRKDGHRVAVVQLGV